MPRQRYRVGFDRFEFDPGTGELWRDGTRVALQPQPARLLQLLLARSGEVVTREEIRAALWGSDVHVVFDRSLYFCVAKLRAALVNVPEPGEICLVAIAAIVLAVRSGRSRRAFDPTNDD